MSAIIQVDHLCKQYGNFKAVDDLSFTVNESDIYGFLGQNGAGKSTTIRMLLTLIRPTHGRINIFGKELHTHRSAILNKVGAMIEKPDLYKYLSAYDNLSIFSRLSGVKNSKERLLKQLQLVGLGERAYDKVRAFSQGMKQRLGIAVALVHDPPLIILDEPTNGLDPQGIAEMRRLIIRLSREMGKTIVISSHLLSEIELMANRMMIIDKGKKIVEGAVNELLDPAHTLVDIDTTDNNKAKQQLAKSSWGKFIRMDRPFQLMMNKEKIPQLVNDLVAMDIEVLSVNPTHSLENYFLSLTTPSGHVDAIAN